ncbi:hypothetical protein GGI43DRAFT_56969 [Trichoderma evansii]
MLSLVRAKLLVAFLVPINNFSGLLLLHRGPWLKERDEREAHGLSLPIQRPFPPTHFSLASSAFCSGLSKSRAPELKKKGREKRVSPPLTIRTSHISSGCIFSAGQGFSRSRSSRRSDREGVAKKRRITFCSAASCMHI